MDPRCSITTTASCCTCGRRRPSSPRSSRRSPGASRSRAWPNAPIPTSSGCSRASRSSPRGSSSRSTRSSPLHAAPAGDGVPGLSRAGAFHGDGALRAGSRRGRPRPGPRAAARQRAAGAALERAGAPHRLRVPHRARREALADRARRGQVPRLSAGAAARAADRPEDPGRDAPAAARDRGAQLRRHRARAAAAALHRQPRRRGPPARGAAVGALGVLVLPATPKARWFHFADASRSPARGLLDDEALLPPPARSFRGYRLLREYFAFPRATSSPRSAGCARPGACKDNELDVLVLLGRADTTLENLVDASNFSLYCTPGDQPLSEARRPHPPLAPGQRAPRRPGPDAADGFRGLRRDRGDSASARAPTEEQRFQPLYASVDQAGRGRRLLHAAPRAAHAVGEAEARRHADQLRGHRGVHVVRRPRGRALRRAASRRSR